MTVYRILNIENVWNDEMLVEGGREKFFSEYEDVEILVEKQEYTVSFSRYKEKGILVFSREEWEEIVNFVNEEISEREREIENADTNS